MTANPLQSPQAGGGLLPCPFCQTGKPHVVNPASGAPPYVLCECGGAGAQRSTEAECIAAWNRRASTSGLAGEAVAKPLEWIECADGTWHDRDCQYELEQTGGFWSVVRGVTGGGYICNCGDLSNAKAAAQADFETRIRSALAVPPSIPAGGVREADIKAICTAFFRWWWNQPGANTDEGFDTWADGEGRALRATLSLPAGGVAVSDAMRDVATERRRQVEAEGWTPEHDDRHHTGDLARAAACYAYEAARTPDQRYLDYDTAPPMWPWDEAWWKPTDPRRDLIKAGALILAEIERLDRLEAALSPEAKTGERS